ncbi:hypothetical protein BDN72DRAFT_955880 [Pluteus cervinus]|uniref:Uncharacterized protein n=1 Tax=Pluteus cervinus TaxID=181527 RepID=A0ACD3B8U2_9AGAR|nr:hypothetical protein BDN72DRAFT_955880 [Pluteus cervinus]
MSLSATAESTTSLMDATTSRRKKVRFLRTRAVDDPPPLRGTLQPNGRPTPLYALAWVFEQRDILGARSRPEVQRESLSNWAPENDAKYGYGLSPYLNVGEDGYIYTIVAYNRKNSLGLAPDLVIAARDALKIQEKDEYTLKWYRFPIKRVEGVDNRAKPFDYGKATSRGKMTSG